jgi:hypothetical protein
MTRQRAKGNWTGQGACNSTPARSRPCPQEDLGLLTGATGGWAGGEAALWKLREEVQAQKAASKAGGAPPAPPAPSKPSVPKPQGGKAPIYLGYSKSDADLRKAGAPGRFILDDPAKYPAKEDLGFFGGRGRPGRSVGWSVGWLVGWLAGRSVGSRPPPTAATRAPTPAQPARRAALLPARRASSSLSATASCSSGRRASPAGRA